MRLYYVNCGLNSIVLAAKNDVCTIQLTIQSLQNACKKFIGQAHGQILEEKKPHESKIIDIDVIKKVSKYWANTIKWKSTYQRPMQENNCLKMPLMSNQDWC